MTLADLPKLTPRQRQAVELVLKGKSHREVARRLKWKRHLVAVTVYQAKKRIESGRVPRAHAPAGSRTCSRGHVRPNSKRCPTCQADRRLADAVELQSERERAVREVNRKLEARGRCQHPMRRGPCGLLRPCAGHEEAMSPHSDETG